VSRRWSKLKSSLLLAALAASARADFYVNGVRCQEGAGIVASTDDSGDIRAVVNCPAAFAPPTEAPSDEIPFVPPSGDALSLREGIWAIGVPVGEQREYYFDVRQSAERVEFDFYQLSFSEAVEASILSRTAVIQSQVIASPARLVLYTGGTIAAGQRYLIRLQNIGDEDVAALMRWHSF
jgi:hypothetical protein